MRRLYFTFPDVKHCKKAVDELLVQRISVDNINVVAKEGTHLDNLPEASLSVRSDIYHSIVVGALIGALLGIGAGLAFHFELNMPLSGLMIVTCIVGAVFGAWASSMIGMMTPNTHLQTFESDIDDGKLLLIVDVPASRAEEIKKSLSKKHPEAIYTSDRKVA